MKQFSQANMNRLYKAGLLALCALCALCALTLSACASSRLPDDAFEGSGPAMTMVVVNHTSRYALNVFADKYWAGDADSLESGGNVCCYPELKDWNEPVTVKWTWGQESDAQTKVVLEPREQHTVVAHFPVRGPSRNDDMYKDEAYLCVILRDIDKAELAFSIKRADCFDK